MFYYSFFSSLEKEKITRIIIDSFYSKDLHPLDVVILTNEIPVKVKEIQKIHNSSKIIIFLVDFNYKEQVIGQLDLLKEASEIWSTEPDIVTLCLNNQLVAKHVPLLHTPRLQYISNNTDPKIDVLLYGTLDFYNSSILKYLIDNGISIFQTDNFDVLNDQLSDVKIVLNLPYAENSYQNQTLMRYLLSNNKCVVSKKSIINHFPNVIETDYQGVIETIRFLLENNNWKNYTHDTVIDNVAQNLPVTEEKNEQKESFKMKNKTKKLVMMSMFQNEAHTIGRMLESCYRYIDFWILQDNGSTDGTPDVVNNFFKDKNIPGFMYKVEEGWVGFGWNRDHLMQVVRQTDHKCDWIIKMDCDETLVVDDDFDWSVFDNTEIPSFHVPALAGGIFYQRAWIYNAKLPWRFNHDDAHETSYIEGVGEGYERVNLPTSFRHVTYDDGQSYGVRTKYLTDALKLEERLIREETMLTDRYHFWYVGKSYYDCFRGDFYPLGRAHSDEFARRSIWYFDQFLNVTHNYNQTGRADRIDEMAYYAMMLNGLSYSFLNNKEKAVDCFLRATDFSPVRNEHWMRLAELYDSQGNYEKMYEITSFMMQPDRVSPFPEYHFMIENDAYYNTGKYLANLHQYAAQKRAETKIPEISVSSSTQGNNFNLKVNANMKKRLFIVDNFYDNPDDVRKFALSLEFQSDIRWYKGLRTKLTFKPEGVKEAFEKIIGEKINVWDEHSYNGCFQITTAEDPQVYHHDVQKWAAMIYLTPDAPIESGTRLHRSKISGARHADDPGIDQAFSGGFIDSTKFDIVDNAGNVFNRLVIMDARCIHSAGTYFGTDSGSGRLIHLFFFD